MKGLELSERYYLEAARPVLHRAFPDLRYSAARLGSGSDVLGFDDETSRDHDWGPKFDLFLSEADHATLGPRIDQVLAEDLPSLFCGFPTRYGLHDDGTADFDPGAGDRHAITLTTPRAFFETYLGIDCSSSPATVDWMTVAPQKLATIASGRVFHDGLDTLEHVRQELAWYPHDLWLYLMANQWRRIDQEEPFVGRTGDVGDELGSRIVATRQVIELMTLCFLMERCYPPYFKWFGTAFARLECAGELSPVLEEVLRSNDWKTRERHLSDAYLILGRMHNELKVTEAVKPEISPFHARPYLVPHSERYVIALHKSIESEEVLSLPRHIGAVWQFADSTDILSSADRLRRLAAVYPMTEGTP